MDAAASRINICGQCVVCGMVLLCGKVLFRTIPIVFFCQQRMGFGYASGCERGVAFLQGLLLLWCQEDADVRQTPTRWYHVVCLNIVVVVV